MSLKLPWENEELRRPTRPIGAETYDTTCELAWTLQGSGVFAMWGHSAPAPSVR